MAHIHKNETEDMTSYHVTSNTLIKFFTEKNATFSFLLDTTIASMFSSRSEKIFSPLPPKYIDMDIVKRDIRSLTVVTRIKTFKDDQESKDSLGDSIYSFLIFMIVSNTMNMTPTVLLKLGETTDSTTSLHLFHPIPQFKIEHPVAVENEFREKVAKNENISSFLYHGSRKENWYSIMRNGLKVYSNNKDMMLNGSCYGHGIYLSDNFNTSMYYCADGKKGSSVGGGRFSDEMSMDTNDFVIGIFEVVGPKTNHRKSQSIYVVTDESLLLIRYILHFPSKDFIVHFGVAEALNEKFNTSLRAEIKQKSMVLSRIAQKRLMSDFRKIQKCSQEHIKINLRDEENLAIWDIMLTGFVPGSRIENDMANYGYTSGLHMEVRFPEDFPNHPPFIRVISPRFEVMTGHVTSGGSICMEVLTNQGWRPTYCLENLMIDIQQMIIDGKGGLDATRHHIPYALQEAYQAFDRMSATHGWY